MVEFDASMGLDSVPTSHGLAGETMPPARSEDTPGDTDTLAGLERLHATACIHCRQAKGHRNLVFGEGREDAYLMFVGEAPGAEEDRLGRPFVGRAGELLDRMISALQLRREDVYIANILKSRPPDNRTPTPEETANCGPWLERQIDLVHPRVIVTLGAVPTRHLLGVTEGITRARGKWGTYEGNHADIPVMPTFHPAYVLRQYTPEVRGAVWNDLQDAKARAYPS